MKKVSYKAKYWKITDSNKLNIIIEEMKFGNNNRCYYVECDRYSRKFKVQPFQIR